MKKDDFSNLDVLILCGGFGKRLNSVTQGIPKPMVKINGRPFLDFLIEYLSAFGFRRFILCTGFKSEIIEQYFKNKNDDNMYIFSKEGEPLGTGGSVKNAEPHILNSNFLILNGDSICWIDLKQFFNFHQSNNASVSMAIASMDDMSQYGSVTLNELSKIKGFKEKSVETSGNGLVNAGIYLFNKSILDKISPGVNVSLEKEVFPSLIRQNFFGFKTSEKLFDIGTPQRLEIMKNHIKAKDS